MRRFIFAERSGIYIIDLQLSLSHIDNAFLFVKSTVVHGGQALFVGTKKQAQEAIAEQVTRVGTLHVNQRWLGGMLTNLHTATKRIQHLKELEGTDLMDSVSNSLTKRELLHLERGKNKLSKTLGGIRDMVRTPQAAQVVDVKKEHLATDEARELCISIVGVLDTNCGPDEVDYTVSGNDNATRLVVLLIRIITDVVAEGLIQYSSGHSGEEVETEPMPDWGRELLAQGDNAAAGASETSEAPAKTKSEQFYKTRRETDIAAIAADVKKLRDATGARMLDAKKALTEVEGDYEKAIELLRISGLAKAAKRTDREATNGVAVGRGGILIQFVVETDFVVKNVESVGLGNQIVDAVTASGVKDLKAAKAAPLGSTTAQEIVQSLTTMIGENLSLVNVVSYDGDTHLYLHRRASDLPPQVGIPVEYTDDYETLVHQVAMHIAAMNPVYISRGEAPTEIVENERCTVEAIVREEDKPEGAIPCIIEGRLSELYKDVVLLDQPAVWEDKKTVDNVLKAAGVEIKRFAYLAVDA